MSEGLLGVLDRFMLLRHSARCPECGAPVGGLTNGAYACDNGGRGEKAPHIYYSRRELDGDIKWWHGRSPLLLTFFIMAVMILYAFARGVVRRE